MPPPGVLLHEGDVGMSLLGLVAESFGADVATLLVAWGLARLGRLRLALQPEAHWTRHVVIAAHPTQA